MGECAGEGGGVCRRGWGCAGEGGGVQERVGVCRRGVECVGTKDSLVNILGILPCDEVLGKDSSTAQTL